MEALVGSLVGSLVESIGVECMWVECMWVESAIWRFGSSASGLRGGCAAGCGCAVWYGCAVGVCSGSYGVREVREGELT